MRVVDLYDRLLTARAQREEMNGQRWFRGGGDSERSPFYISCRGARSKKEENLKVVDYLKKNDDDLVTISDLRKMGGF